MNHNDDYHPMDDSLQKAALQNYIVDYKLYSGDWKINSQHEFFIFLESIRVRQVSCQNPLFYSAAIAGAGV